RVQEAAASVRRAVAETVRVHSHGDQTAPGVQGKARLQHGTSDEHFGSALWHRRMETLRATIHVRRVDQKVVEQNEPLKVVAVRIELDEDAQRAEPKLDWRVEHPGCRSVRRAYHGTHLSRALSASWWQMPALSLTPSTCRRALFVGS